MINLTISNTLLACQLHENTAIIGDGVRCAVLSPCSHVLDLKNTGYSIHQICSNAFAESNVKSVIFPDNLTLLGNGAFRHCLDLNAVDLSNTKITYLNQYTFCHCKNLKSIKFPSTLRGFEDYSIAYTDISSIGIPCNVDFIIGSFISGCYNFQKFEGPYHNFDFIDNVLYNSMHTYIVCIIPSIKQFDYFQVERLGKGCCEGSLIEQIVIKKYIKFLGERALANCFNLKKIIIENGFQSTGPYVFMQISIPSIELPESFNGIQHNSFTGSLFEIIDLSKSSIGVVPCSCFEDCRFLKVLYLPKSIRQIQARAFAFCPQLIDITIPKSVIVLQEFAFINSSFKMLNLSNTRLKTISENSLLSDKLERVILPRVLVRINNNAFGGRFIKLEYYGSRNFSKRCKIEANVIVGQYYQEATFCGSQVSKDNFSYSYEPT